MSHLTTFQPVMRFAYDGIGPMRVLILLKYSYLAGVGFSNKACLECEGLQLYLQCLGRKEKGKDGATVSREAEAGGLQVLGANETLSQNTKYQND